MENYFGEEKHYKFQQILPRKMIGLVPIEIIEKKAIFDFLETIPLEKLKEHLCFYKVDDRDPQKFKIQMQIKI